MQKGKREKKRRKIIENYNMNRIIWHERKNIVNNVVDALFKA